MGGVESYRKACRHARVDVAVAVTLRAAVRSQADVRPRPQSERVTSNRPVSPFAIE